MDLLINKNCYVIKIHHIYYKMNFDLDIHNYSKPDLEDLLDLKYPYSSDDITNKCTVFQESVLNNSSLDNIFSSKITTFLDNVKIKLINKTISNDDLLSHRNFENPKLPNSKVLQVGNTQIMEQNLRDSNKASQPSTTALSSSLSYNLAGDEAPGKMNPLYKRTLNKTLNIDTRFRDNYYSTHASDFLLTLPMKFSNVIQLQLSEIELPLTFYAISKSLKNNYFWIRMIVNNLNKFFFNFDLWKFGIFDNGNWVQIESVSELRNVNNNKHVMGYTMIEIPDGNYIHTDMVKFLNQKVSTLFSNISTGDSQYAELIKFVIDINSSGSGSGKTIVSSTTYSFPNLTNTGPSGSGIQLEDANLISVSDTGEKQYGIPAASTLFELNFAAPNVKIVPGSDEWINKNNPNYLSFNTVQDTYNERSTHPLPLGFGWILGFRHPLYTSYNKLTQSPIPENVVPENKNLSEYPGCSYVSEGFFECHGPRYLFLVVDDFNNNVNTNMFSAFNSSILSKNILARISVKGTVFSILSDDAKHITSAVREYFGPVNIEKIRIQLLDEYGRILEMNNMDFSMALNIKSVYDS